MGSHFSGHETDFGPIFIVGVHRSGTTWLHQLLVETGCFDFVSAYHIIRYDDLPTQPRDLSAAPAYQELCERFARLGLGNRLIDDLEISPGLPEEYGFVLENAGTGPRLRPANVRILEELCRRLRSSAERRIVLKNPWDAANFLFMKQAFPNARFLFIHRHPERVVHSSLNANRSLLGSRNAYVALLSRDYERLFADGPGPKLRLRLRRFFASRRLGTGVRLTTAVVAISHRYFVRNISRLSPRDYLSFRYEDLCERPVEILGGILEFLEVDPDRAASLRIRPTPRHTGLLPEVESYRDSIARMTAPYMQLLGYRPGEVTEPRSGS